jgi:hypothetical protein
MIYSFPAERGRQLRVPILIEAATTGLELADFTIISAAQGSHLADPAATLTLTLEETDDVEAPGYYELLVVPHVLGLISVVLQYGGETHGAYLHVGLPNPYVSQYGAEGTHTFTVQDSGENPIEGVVVRVFTSAGGGMLARGTTDAAGQASFDLPAGDYEARLTKSGYSFSNPEEFTVVEGEVEDPYVDFLLPTTAAVASRVAISGRFFTGDNVTVLAGGETVSPDISADGRLLTFLVPDVDSPATIIVRKDDPDNVGEYLTSESLTLTVS